MNRKRLLIMNFEYPPLGGGGGVACEKIARRLSIDRMYDVTVLTSCAGSSVLDERDSFGVRVIRVPCAVSRKNRTGATLFFMIQYLVRSVLYIVKNGRKLECQYVYSFFGSPTALAGYVVSKLLAVPHIITLIGGELYKQPLEEEIIDSPIQKIILKFLVNRAQAVTAISGSIRDAARKSLHPAKEIRVVSLGFEPPEYDFPGRMIDNDKVELVSISRLVKRKDYPALLNALSGIRSRKWSLKVIGDGPEKDMLTRLCESLDISEKVMFLDYVEERDKFRILAESDLFVLPTLHEGMGIVFFEAMFCGLPIVTTNHGGQVDFLKERENALLVSPGDVKALQCALAEAIDDPKWRIETGLRNKKAVCDYYLEKLSGIYDEILQHSAVT